MHAELHRFSRWCRCSRVFTHMFELPTPTACERRSQHTCFKLTTFAITKPNVLPTPVETTPVTTKLNVRSQPLCFGSDGSRYGIIGVLFRKSHVADQSSRFCITKSQRRNAMRSGCYWTSNWQMYRTTFKFECDLFCSSVAHTDHA